MIIVMSNAIVQINPCMMAFFRSPSMNNEEAIELSHYPGGRPHGQVIIIQMLVIDDVSTIIMIIDIYTMPIKPNVS